MWQYLACFKYPVYNMHFNCSQKHPFWLWSNPSNLAKVILVEISGLECNWIFWIFFYFNTKLGSKVGMIIVVKTPFQLQLKWSKTCILTVIEAVENIHFDCSCSCHPGYLMQSSISQAIIPNLCNPSTLGRGYTDYWYWRRDGRWDVDLCCKCYVPPWNLVKKGSADVQYQQLSLWPESDAL